MMAVKMRMELWNNTVYVKQVTSQVSFRHEQIFFTDENSYKKIVGEGNIDEEREF
jgi:hypothetical protein